MIICIIGFMTFYPILGYPQESKIAEIVFDEPIAKELFFTKEFIQYLDSLPFTRGQKDRYLFNGVENWMGMITEPMPFNSILRVTHNFFLRGKDEEDIIVNLAFTEKEGGKTQISYNVKGVYRYGSDQELYLDLMGMMEKGFIRKKGLKAAGIWKDIVNTCRATKIE